MKKLFATFLTAAMVASTAVPALAATDLDESPANGKSEGEYNIGVDGNYFPGGDVEETISVDIKWEALNFTYTDGDATYYPDTHTTTTADGSWSTDTATITVTNHSNVSMRADFSFTATAQGVKGVLTQNYVIIPSAEQEKYQENKGTEEEPAYDAPAASTAFGIDPTSSAISADGTLGTITVSLAKYDGFAYDATGVDERTLRDALAAAYRNGYRTFAITGEPGDVTWIDAALQYDISQNDDSTIDLTLCDVTTLSNSAFNLCKKLKSITLPKVTTIGENVFESCTFLESVNAPSVTSVGFSAFKDCTALTSISMPAVATVDKYAFENCTALTTVSLPKCTTLAANAFRYCSNLATVELPLATEIGIAAFSGCTTLTDISLPEATKIASSAFNSCTALTTVSLPKCTQVEYAAFNDCTALTTVSLPEVTTVGNTAFSGCTELATVSLPKCTTLGENAFYECSKLASVSLPIVTTVGQNAFYKCTALTDISLPEVTKIETSAFRSCTALTTVSLPKCTNVGDAVFYDCDSMESLTFGTPVTAWGLNVFRYNKTANVTLTFANGQKTFEQDRTGNPWYLTSTYLTGGTDVKFCECTFKEIIISAPAT